METENKELNHFHERKIDVSKRVLWEWQFDRENRFVEKLVKRWIVNNKQNRKHDDKIYVKMEDAKEYLWFEKMDEFAKKC